MATPRDVCSDCGETAHEIKLIDSAHYGGHKDMEYTVPEASRSFITGRYPVTGKITATMCEACGRITYYGVPKK